MFPTTIAGSLPKPSWLAEPDKLWPQWRLTGADLATAKLDATLLALKLQEDAGVDIVTDGEQSRQHFVHGFLEFVDGIDFANKVEIGIRNDRYKAMVPTVTGPLTLKGRVHAAEARFARAHTKRKLEGHHARADDHHRHHRRQALWRPRQYFKGAWTVPFNKFATKDEDFLSESKPVPVPMMHVTSQFGYLDDAKRIPGLTCLMPVTRSRWSCSCRGRLTGWPIWKRRCPARSWTAG